MGKFPAKAQILHLRFIALASFYFPLFVYDDPYQLFILVMTTVCSLLQIAVLFLDLPLNTLRVLTAVSAVLSLSKMLFMSPILGPFSIFPAVIAITYLVFCGQPRRTVSQVFRMLWFFVFAGAAIHKIHPEYFQGSELLVPNSFFGQMFSPEQRAALHQHFHPAYAVAAVAFEAVAALLAVLHWPLCVTASLIFLASLNTISSNMFHITLDFLAILVIVSPRFVPKFLKKEVRKSPFALLGFSILFYGRPAFAHFNFQADIVLPGALLVCLLTTLARDGVSAKTSESGLSSWPASLTAWTACLILYVLAPRFAPLPKQIGFSMFDGRPTFRYWPSYGVRDKQACEDLMTLLGNRFPNSSLYSKRNSDYWPEIKRRLNDYECIWVSIDSPYQKYILARERAHFGANSIDPLGKLAD